MFRYAIPKYKILENETYLLLLVFISVCGALDGNDIWGYVVGNLADALPNRSFIIGQVLIFFFRLSDSQL